MPSHVSVGAHLTWLPWLQQQTDRADRHIEGTFLPSLHPNAGLSIAALQQRVFSQYHAPQWQQHSIQASREQSDCVPRTVGPVCCRLRCGLLGESRTYCPPSPVPKQVCQQPVQRRMPCGHT